MNAAALLRTLNARGVVLQAEGGKLHYTAPKGALTADLREQIAIQKPALLALLGAGATVMNLTPGFSGFSFFTPEGEGSHQPPRRPSSGREMAGREETKASKAPRTGGVPHQAEPGTCHACQGVDWWMGAGMVRCTRCVPPSALADAPARQAVLDAAERLGWPRVEISERLTITDEAGWRHWAGVMHAAAAPWLVTVLQLLGQFREEVEAAAEAAGFPPLAGVCDGGGAAEWQRWLADADHDGLVTALSALPV